jgi:hypothetical protein
MIGKDDIVPQGVKLRDFDDFSALREDTFTSVAGAFQNRFPQEYGKYRMELDNVHYPETKDFDLDQQKNALMKNQFLGKRLRGTFKLYDKDSGDFLEEKEVTLMRVPYVTDRGTVIHNGNEYVTLNQARLSSGVYTRKKESGELEAHINAKRGTGRSYKLRMEPNTSLYKLDIDQASLRLYSLLHDLGVSDDELEKRWGPDILEANRAKYDSRVLDKAYNKLVREPTPSASKEEKANAVRDALNLTKLSRSSVERTLPNMFNQKTASDWRKYGFQQNPQMQNFSPVQSSDEFVKWDQKRQELEAKAQQKQEQAEFKRDLDVRRKKLEIQGLNADILNESGQVDPHSVVKQVMQNISNRQKTERTIKTKKITKEIKHQGKQYVDKLKSEDKLQDRFHDIKDKADQERIEQEREHVLAQIRQSLPQQQIPQQPPVQGLMPEQSMMPEQPMLPKFASHKSENALGELLQAKSESDEKKYHHKQNRLRKLMREHPSDFYLTTKDDQGIYGVTHAPTGFRMHLPKHVFADLDIDDRTQDNTDVRASAVDLLGLDKSSASIESASINIAAPNYRAAESEEESCGACNHISDSGHCNAFNFDCAVDYTCDAWKEDTVKYAAKGRYEQAPGNRKDLHTAKLHNGHEVDVLALRKKISDKPVEDVPVLSLNLKGANRSRSTGYGPKRYENANTSEPIIIDGDNNIIDGRHRYFKCLDLKEDTIPVQRASSSDVADCYTGNMHPDSKTQTKQ